MSKLRLEHKRPTTNSGDRTGRALYVLGVEWQEMTLGWRKQEEKKRKKKKPN